MTNAEYQRKRMKQGPCLIATLHRIIKRHCRAQGIEPESALTDALTDMRHLADIYELDFSALESEASDGYREELAGVLSGELL